MKTTSMIFLPIIVITTICSISTAQWIHTDTLCKGNVNDLIIQNGFLFAGTQNGIYRSSNNGLHWVKAETGLTTNNVLSFGVCGTKLFAGTAAGGIFLSTNDGTVWSTVNGGLSITNVNNFAVCPPRNGSSDTTIFASFTDTLYKGCIYRTTDFGKSWNSVSTGITNTDVRAIAVCDTNIFVGTMGGVFLSANDGATWTPKNSGLNVQYVVSLLSSDSIIFAGTISGGAYRSTDHGTLWEMINEGLTNTYVNAFAKCSKGSLFAGTGWNGVYCSTNNGTNWKNVNTGFTTFQINALAVDSDSRYVYAATDDGVWYRPISEMSTDLHEESEQIPYRLILEQNFPNPFNPSTTIRYALPSSANVKIIIYDLLGREIVSLVNEDQSAGWKEVEWNATNVSSGIYFYKILANNFVETKKMSLIR